MIPDDGDIVRGLGYMVIRAVSIVTVRAIYRKRAKTPNKQENI